jgi:2'-5' RNA ligase
MSTEWKYSNSQIIFMPNASEHNQTRRQLTLFIRERDKETIEKIRKRYNPIQYQLISAHVTLCREDEIAPLDMVIENMKSFKIDCPLKITFDPVDRFEGGSGVWLPASTENQSFHALRKQILSGIKDTPRPHQPHLTIMHPRNSTCTDSIFEAIKQYNLPTELSFDNISLIEQKSGGRWSIIDEYKIILAS